MLSTVFSPLIGSLLRLADRRYVSQDVVKGQESTSVLGAVRQFLRFPFVPVFYHQEAGDEADQNYVPISLGPFPNGANFDG